MALCGEGQSAYELGCIALAIRDTHTATTAITSMSNFENAHAHADYVSRMLSGCRPSTSRWWMILLVNDDHCKMSAEARDTARDVPRYPKIRPPSAPAAYPLHCSRRSVPHRARAPAS